MRKSTMNMSYNEAARKWVVCYVSGWLDANEYNFVAKLNQYLNESKIPYEHKQSIKTFQWWFENQQDAMAFHITWCGK